MGQKIIKKNNFKPSSDEKQGLILVRALVGRSHFLVLDETISALDKKNYNLIEQKILRTFSGILIHLSHYNINNKDYAYYIKFKMILKKDNATIFVLSLLYSLFILLIERLIHIDIYYHPDSLFYLENSNPQTVISFLQNPLIYMGNFYYVVVGYFNSEIIPLISLNIFLFSLTNLILFSKVRDIYSKNGLLFYCSVLIIIFDPYRAHLSVHVLKDTIIIFSLVLLLFTSSSFFKFVGLSLGFSLRYIFFIYLPIIFFYPSKNRNYTFFRLSFIIFIFIFYKDYISIGILFGSEQSDISFRYFDVVPNLIDIEYPLGNILRSITWPIIRLTGSAFVFHPLYFLFFFQSIAAIYLIFHDSHHIKKKLFFLLIIFTIFAFLAFAVTGYNSYLRWTQPLMTVFPIWSLILFFKNINRKIKI